MIVGSPQARHSDMLLQEAPSAIHSTPSYESRMEDLDPLIISASSGDVAAFERLVLRFQGMAVGYAFAILGDFHLAEDAAQEAFVEAYARLPSLREPRAFANWLKRIVF